MPPQKRPAAVELPAYERYTRGLRAYELNQFQAAQEEFRRAVAKDDADARYHYFLGLADWKLGKREAALEQFRRGVRLENDHKPSPVFIQLALDRADGEALAALNRYRR